MVSKYRSQRKNAETGSADDEQALMTTYTGSDRFRAVSMQQVLRIMSGESGQR